MDMIAANSSAYRARLPIRLCKQLKQMPATARIIERLENVIAVHRIMTLVLLVVLVWGYMTNFGRY